MPPTPLVIVNVEDEPTIVQSRVVEPIVKKSLENVATSKPDVPLVWKGSGSG
jgi:hypothetical protein